MAELESAFHLAGKYVRSAAEIAVAEDHQSAYRPQGGARRRGLQFLGGAVRIVGELEASFKKYPPIKLGTPDPYTPEQAYR
ncbi:hypothetical protein QCM80_11055 [Bradyrhizobium sp. SSUT112]|uniref:hypothetical protein n=1 Tax=Bradyrhizobium sp. SSUT112 TaxID=3040604 RepID=UPI00244804DC|nr:hypothetical protein [Bradyrhizobium sp. SSUT112]MDH2351205.1 hypothetical protein [Bradyrhizobium sp. SSUT112]